LPSPRSRLACTHATEDTRLRTLLAGVFHTRFLAMVVGVAPKAGFALLERLLGGSPTHEPAGQFHAHNRDLRGGGLRAAVFGVSDGLVSNVSLVLGTAGAHPGGGVIRLAGLA